MCIRDSACSVQLNVVPVDCSDNKNSESTFHCRNVINQCELCVKTNRAVLMLQEVRFAFSQIAFASYESGYNYRYIFMKTKKALYVVVGE